MAVQFILGRSGTGKTSLCIQSIIDCLKDTASAQPLVLLVPEQATYQAERAILANQEIAGFSRLSVLSFDRLKYLLLGKNASTADISRLGQQMILQKILAQNAHKLIIYKNSAHLPGLASQLTQTIIELHEADKDFSDIAELTENLKAGNAHLAALKFADIATIMHEYLNFIEPAFTNPDILLTEARTKIADSPLLKNAQIWVDGFASFTIQQLLLLAELMQSAEYLSIALCLDPAAIDLKKPELEPTSIFNQTERTYENLIEIIKKRNLTCAEPKILNAPLRFTNCPPLAHIEANIFQPSQHKAIQSDSAIKITPASNARAEVTNTARQITDLVRNKNFRFRDIAVIVSDMTAYQHYIEATFPDYGIEYFIDRPKPMLQHPVVELIASALSTATTNFPSSDIFAYLKTDLANLTRPETDSLENYCLAFGVETSSWTQKQDWDFAAGGRTHFNEKKINELRKKTTAPLLKLKNALKINETITTADFTRAIFDLLKELKVAKNLAEHNDPNDQNAQFFDKLVTIFDELNEIFASDRMTAQELTAILLNAFATITLKLIPQKLDQVLISSIDRSRHPELKAVLLIGATQKQFPSSVKFDPILTDSDRAAAQQHDFILSERIAQQLTARQYLAYIAFTRPTHLLNISYPLTDDTGKSLMPSPFIANLQKLFTDLELEYATQKTDLENITSKNQLAQLICENLAPDNPTPNPDFLNLTEQLLADTELNKTGQFIKNALAYKNQATLETDRLPAPPTSIICSNSRLRNFAACPYKHFAKYTLRLKERQLAGFEPIDLGNFYHTVLDKLAKALKKQNLDFATASEKQLSEACEKQIELILTADHALAHFIKDSVRNRFVIDSASQVLRDCIHDYATLSRAGTFRQMASEISFGASEINSTRLTLQLSNNQTLNLNGIIDRVDIAEIKGKQVALIFDYKRKETSLSWSNIYHALDMQMPIYMLAAKNLTNNGKPIDAIAGAFYLPVESPPQTASLTNLENPNTKFRRKAKGILNGTFFQYLDSNAEKGWNGFYNFAIKDDQPYGNFNNSASLKPDQFENLLEFAKTKIKQLAEDIIAGKIDINPTKTNSTQSCDYCPYKPLCRFDPLTNACNYRPKIKKEQILDELGAADAV
ncbi:MAG: hypothetical protein FVQ79_05635 [Planctomycetes bacterium]|nr:hypothetical protein [Planctomycetota bacterium]